MLRIGEVAARTGTTPRTIRYYEELGLLPGTTARPSGCHRLYDEADVDRLHELLRLKDLLGVSLEELRELVAAEDVPDEALGHVERQLALVAQRREEIERLEAELTAKRRRLHARLEGMAPVVLAASTFGAYV